MCPLLGQGMSGENLQNASASLVWDEDVFVFYDAE